MQICKFIMQYMRVTQGYGRDILGAADYTSYSHAGSYALDLGGRDAGADWAYAPCDVMAKKVEGKCNTVWFETLDKVMCADGKARNLVFMLKHIDNEDLAGLGIRPGRIFRQGEKFYREGSAGTVGNHIHIEVGLGPFALPCRQKTSLKSADEKQVLKIKNQLMPHDVFFVCDDVLLLDTGGYSWKSEDTKPEEQSVHLQNKLLKQQVENLSEALAEIGEIVESMQV